ncbi:MAG: KUP/HAK/KT family potassium transporter, partial [Candidatus Zixiibacteriota bacterium]
IKYPRVFEAVFPWHGLSFLIANKLPGFLVLGAVFLVVTGAEALYADLGHFGKQPIRVSWIIPVLPCLILNYFGQGALLIQDPNQVAHPFYAMVPTWAMIPMVMLATTATIIASQAVIAGTFSLTRQAVQLGYLPRLRIRHTSSSHIGQIYVPFVNWGLWLATTLLVITIQSSSKLAAAYGVAVTSTMLIASILFFVVARQIWKWKLLPAAALTGLFLLVDIAFFSANITKILHGAWIPLMIGGVLFMLMTVWRGGRTRLAEQFRSTTISWEQFIQSLEATEISRVAGQAIYLSGSPGIVPSVLLNNMKHNQVLHSQVASLHITTETVPRVDNDEKVEIIEHGKNFFSIIARYGFMESPDIVNILSLARQQSVTFDIDKTSFFLGRERLLTSGGNGMRLWGKRIFSFLSRNALDASAFYNIPSNRIIEIGIQLKL